MPYDLQKFADQLAKRTLPVTHTRSRQFKKIIKGGVRSLSVLSQLVSLDPGLSTRILRHVNYIKSKINESEAIHINPIEINSVLSAINLMGEDKLISLISALPVLEEKIEDQRIVEDYKRLLDRCIHASHFAGYWARLRGDSVPGEIEIASLLRDIGEMAVCIYAHDAYREIDQRSKENTISRARISADVLGFSFMDLSMELSRRWWLPDIVRDGIDNSRWQLLRTECIMLASECARLIDYGWYHHNVSICEELVSSYLNIDYARVCRDLHLITLSIERKGVLHQRSSYAHRLVEPAIESSEWDQRPPIYTTDQDKTAIRPHAAPKPPDRSKNMPVFALTVKKIRQCVGSNTIETGALIKLMTNGIVKGLGCQRVILSLYDDKKNQLVVKKSHGIALVKAKVIDFSCEKNTLFYSLMQSQKFLLINKKNFLKMRAFLPHDFYQQTGEETFICASLFMGEAPLGLIYADRLATDDHDTAQLYKDFKMLVGYTCKALVPCDKKQA